MEHERFHYNTLQEVKNTAERVNAYVPLSEDTLPLFDPLKLNNGVIIKNRFAFQPMEGSDGTEDGAPGPLTVRRYERFAKGGPGIIWFEAVATLNRARASKHQLMLTEKNLAEFERLTDMIRETSIKENGYAPVIIMQCTNSGRYAKPNGFPEPMIAYHAAPLEETPLPENCIVTDDDLKRFEEAYVKSARLCQKAGFDGIDIKSCHRYLASELLSAYNRPGEYGGSYENRTRFLKNCYRAAKSGVVSDEKFIFSSRLNAYDGFPYPYGFGVTEENGLTPDLTEAKRLIKELEEEFNIPMINITMGNPYKNPHVNRPYDNGNYIPDEHPFTGISRLMSGIREIQKTVDIPVIGSGFSYLRRFSVNLASAMVSEGNCAVAGFGRMAFAYPDFIRDLRENGNIDDKRVCITCGGCAKLLRAGQNAGCIARDRSVYKPV